MEFQIIPGKVRPLTPPRREPSTGSDHCSPTDSSIAQNASETLHRRKDKRSGFHDRHERGNVDTLSAETQVKIGGQLSATLGPVGREAETSLNFNGTSEIRGTYAYTWSKGVFGGISMETAVLKVRPKENARFYGKESVSSKEILENTLAAPKDMGVKDLHYKLDLLSKGKALVLTPAQVERKSSMRNLADEAGVLAKSVQTDVMEVDADEEVA